MSRRIHIILAVGIAALPLASPAGAQEPPASHFVPDATLEPGTRRALPDYAGRPEPGPDSVDVALWIPRVLLSPLYLVTEFLVRRPLGWVLYELERRDFFRELHDCLTFFPDRRAGLIPTALFEFGFQPSVGLYAYWNRFLFDQNRISVHAATWGADWLMLTVLDRVQLAGDFFVATRFAALRRPDQIFGGIGWQATQLEPSRYAVDEIDASLWLGVRPYRRSAVDLGLGFRTDSFRGQRFGSDPGVGEHGPLPAGFAEGYNAGRVELRATLDSREMRELSTGGVIASAFATAQGAFGGVPFTPWLRWGGSLVLATDPLGFGRVFSLGAQAQFVTALDGAEESVPFTELIDLGAPSSPMRAFRPGVVRGYSLAAVTATYVWPIWFLLDASLRVSVGNVFGPHLEDFALDRLRLGFDVGVRPRDGGEQLFELLFGLGTQVFGVGAQLTEVRITVGSRSSL